MCELIGSRRETMSHTHLLLLGALPEGRGSKKRKLDSRPPGCLDLRSEGHPQAQTWHSPVGISEKFLSGNGKTGLVGDLNGASPNNPGTRIKLTKPLAGIKTLSTYDRSTYHRSTYLRPIYLRPINLSTINLPPNNLSPIYLRKGKKTQKPKKTPKTYHPGNCGSRIPSKQRSSRRSRELRLLGLRPVKLGM